ncbi:MAG: 50S ribosomal protein L19 [Planctomycetota bacterium]
MANEETSERDEAQLKGQDLIRAIENDYQRDDVPHFSVGDTIQVGVQIVEGDTTRVQNFTGTCIGRRGTGARETFTVRRLVQGEGVERIFPLHCPTIDHITVERHGKARRAKLNYLRERKGRSAKLKERREVVSE